MAAGASITFQYRSSFGGVLQVATPNKVTIEVYDDAGTLVKSFLSAGAEPAQGTTYTFFATANGASGGGDRAGTYEIYLKVVKDNAGLGSDNYNVDSRGTATVGSLSEFHKGALRASMDVSAIAASAYPAGTKFAYGTAANEQVTLTVTHTQKNCATGNETVRTKVRLGSGGAVKKTGSTTALDASTSFTQAHTIDNALDTGDVTYDVDFEVIGNSMLLGIAWTTLTASGSVTNIDAATDRKTGLFVANPDITLNTVTVDNALHNRGENATHTFKVVNSRSENITRSLAWDIKDSGGTTKASKSGAAVSQVYGGAGVGDYTIGATDKATFDLTGDQWAIAITTADARATNTPNIYSVSRKWQASTSASSIDNRIFTGKTATPTTRNVTRNRSQDVFWDLFVYNARGELLASPTVNFGVKRIGGASFDFSSGSMALSSGHMNGASAKYTSGSGDAVEGKTLVVGSSAISTTNQPRTGTAGSGNFAESDTSTAEWSISATLTVTAHLQLDNNKLDPALNVTKRLTSNLGFVAMKVVDASGDVVNGASGNFSFLDDASLVSAESSGTVVTAAQNGHDGYTPLVGWADALPGGGWDIWADGTAGTVAFTTGGNTGSFARKGIGTADFTLAAADPSIVVITGSGPTLKGGHMVAGKTYQAGIKVVNVDTAKHLAVDTDGASVLLGRNQDSGANIGYAEFLDSDLTWKRWDGSAVLYFWPCTETIAGNTRVYIKTFTASQTSGWGTYDIFVVGKAVISGVPYGRYTQSEVVGPYCDHGMGT